MGRFLSLLKEYFESSTVHGFRYVVTGKSVIARVAWAVIIIAALGVSLMLCLESLSEDRKYPVQTQVESKSMSSVPFPAVTVGLDSPVDEWAILRNALNLFEFDCSSDRDPSARRTCPKSQAIRQYFLPLLEQVVEQLLKRAPQFRHSAPNFSFESFTKIFNNLGALADGVRSRNLTQSDVKDYLHKPLVRASARVVGIYLGNNLKASLYQTLTDLFLPLQGDANVTCSSSRNVNTICRQIYTTTYPYFRLLQAKSWLGDITPLGTFLSYVCQSKTGLKGTCGLVNSLSQEIFSAVIRRDGKRFDLRDWVNFFSGAEFPNKERHVNMVDGFHCSVEDLNYAKMQIFCTNKSWAENHGLYGCCLTFDFLQVTQRAFSILMPSTIDANAEDCNERLFLRRALSTGALSKFSLKPLPNSCIVVANSKIKLATFPVAGESIDYRSGLWQSHFRPSVSDEGGALSFNLERNAFEDLDREEIHKANPRDPSFGMNLLIRSEIKFPGRHYDQNKRSVARMVLSSPYDLPSLKHESAKLLPGFEYHFRLSASLIRADKSLSSLPEAERQCRFEHENEEMVLFDEYSQKKCMFECQLKTAFNKCGCRPWNYPDITINKTADICFLEQLVCHDNVMNKAGILDNCECPDDCEVLDYSTSQMIYQMDSVCSQENVRDSYSLHEKGNGAPQLARDVEYVSKYRDTYEKQNRQVCWNEANNAIIVHLELGGQKVNIVKNSKRTSFSSTLSSLGGTIGLFCGMSILSFIELAFFLVSYLCNLVHRCRVGKKRRPRQTKSSI